MRGYSAIALHQPKIEANLGTAMRGAHVLGAQLMILSQARYKKQCADTTKAYRNIPLLETDNLKSCIPFDCVPVAVELLDDAESLLTFRHPERALYIFGGEDKTLGNSITEWCKHKVYVPTKYCMNLAATVHVVLYDRMLKEQK
jgi:tRNA(Leu) C34 or U34 (ribose-2'-O)-methylase TrmL